MRHGGNGKSGKSGCEEEGKRTIGKKIELGG